MNTTSSIKKYKNLDFYDACATISMFTVLSIYEGIKKTEIDCDYIYLVGGGSRNQFISSKLSNLVPGKIKFINKLSLSDNYIESQAFAYLGIRSIKKLPISYPKTTGIKKALSGGDLY